MVKNSSVLKYAVIGVVFLIFILGKQYYHSPKFSKRELAPDFIISESEHKMLSDLKGSFVLIEFWGSWCGPCRAGHPDLVKMYKEIKSQSSNQDPQFEIVSVAIERSKSAWQKAIAKDGLIWPYHVYNESTSLRFFNGDIAKLYGITETPSKYLINPEGEITAVNPSIEEIKNLINKRS